MSEKISNLPIRTSKCRLPLPVIERVYGLIDLSAATAANRSTVMASLLLSVSINDMSRFRDGVDEYSGLTLDHPTRDFTFSWPEPVFERANALEHQGRTANVTRNDLIGFSIMSAPTQEAAMERLVLDYRKLEIAQFNPNAVPAALNPTSRP